ncbi:hypothetical protein HMPREF3224_02080 [Anaerococcus hydrogenalis]|nr:hypothetical protein HMPREF3224_02080 [Anaerococcus hydrogenalis]
MNKIKSASKGEASKIVAAGKCSCRPQVECNGMRKNDAKKEVSYKQGTA